MTQTFVHMILKHIPNMLTLARLILIAPFIVYFYHHEYVLAFYTFVIAGLTDALDGWIARYYNWQSSFGSIIDPVADKLLITASFISLAITHILPWWLVILVFLRDLTISLGAMGWYYFIQRKYIFTPTFLSKINTVLQLSLVTICLFDLAYTNISQPIITAMINFTAITTACSYIDYVLTWGKKACLQRPISK